MNEQISQKIKSFSAGENKSVSDLNLKALVVEDFETMRNIIAKVLDSLNIKITEAANGRYSFDRSGHAGDGRL